jgi:ubiquinone biosynthesis protein
MRPRLGVARPSPRSSWSSRQGGLSAEARLATQFARGTVVAALAARRAGRYRRYRGDAPAERQARAGRELRALCVELGPTYVKLAQLASSSPGLFPRAIADELRTLLDEVPPASPGAMAAIVEEDLGAPPSELFEFFDSNPLAAASVAQVHAARLADGTDVVVKIQRPEIRRRLAADVNLLHHAARVLERSSQLGRMANPVAVVEDLVQTLEQELNFVVEARSMERWQANLRAESAHEGVRAPQVHWPLTTRRVLTMERVHGIRFDDVEAAEKAGLDLKLALRSGARAFVATAFRHGFFHGDMHAGNLLVDSENRLVFLDFGICGTLERSVLEELRVALPAMLIERDYTKIATAVYGMGGIERPQALDRAAEDIKGFLKPLLKQNLSEIAYGRVLMQVAELGATYGFRMPRPLVLLAKQALYCERYAKLVAPDWNLLGDPEILQAMLTGRETATAA